MNYRILLTLLTLFCLSPFITGCQSTGSITTTATSESATISGTMAIAPGASITSANVPAGETVANFAAPNLTLNLPATVTGTASATIKNTLAGQITLDQNEVVLYTEDAGVQLEKYLPVIEADAGNAVAIANDIQGWLSASGLEKADSKEAGVEAKITSDITKASTDASLLNTVVAGLTVGIQ